MKLKVFANQKNLICDKQCSDEGCWGPNSNECLKCKSYRLEDTC